jgi:hypothetical protein
MPLAVRHLDSHSGKEGGDARTPSAIQDPENSAHCEENLLSTERLGISILFNVNQLASLRLKAERDRAQLWQRPTDLGMSIHWRIEQEKTSSSSSQKLASNGPMSPGSLIPSIDARTRDATGQAPLFYPVGMEYFAEPI